MMGEIMAIMVPFSISYICNYLHYYQGTQLFALMLDPCFQIFGCGGRFCKKRKSHIDSG
jgi:hypothetical protein